MYLRSVWTKSHFQINVTVSKYMSMPTLTKEINSCFNKCCLPTAWKLLYVTSIPKPGKNLQLSDYRPIALLSSLHMLKYMFFNLRKSLVSKREERFAFQPGHHTTHQLTKTRRENQRQP